MKKNTTMLVGTTALAEWNPNSCKTKDGGTQNRGMYIDRLRESVLSL